MISKITKLVQISAKRAINVQHIHPKLVYAPLYRFAENPKKTGQTREQAKKEDEQINLGEKHFEDQNAAQKNKNLNESELKGEKRQYRQGEARGEKEDQQQARQNQQQQTRQDPEWEAKTDQWQSRQEHQAKQTQQQYKQDQPYRQDQQQYRQDQQQARQDQQQYGQNQQQTRQDQQYRQDQQQARQEQQQGRQDQQQGRQDQQQGRQEQQQYRQDQQQARKDQQQSRADQQQAERAHEQQLSTGKEEAKQKLKTFKKDNKGDLLEKKSRDIWELMMDAIAGENFSDLQKLHEEFYKEFNTAFEDMDRYLQRFDKFATQRRKLVENQMQKYLKDMEIRAEDLNKALEREIKQDLDLGKNYDNWDIYIVQWIYPEQTVNQNTKKEVKDFYRKRVEECQQELAKTNQKADQKENMNLARQKVLSECVEKFNLNPKTITNIVDEKAKGIRRRARTGANNNNNNKNNA